MLSNSIGGIDMMKKKIVVLVLLVGMLGIFFSYKGQSGFRGIDLGSKNIFRVQ